MSSRRPRVEFAARARRDYQNILLQSRRTWGDQQMLAYEATLQNTLANLATFPAMGTECEDLAPGLRSFPVGSHLIVYRFGR